MKRNLIALVMLAAACAHADSELPARFVDYIESHGTEYLDLGNVLTSNTVATAIVREFRVASPTSAATNTVPD